MIRGGEQATWESRFGRMLVTEEQPFVRKSKIGLEWQPLETGWVKDCACILLINEEGKLGHVYPTEEEKREVAERIIELGTVNGTDDSAVADWEIPPGESFRGSPALDLRLLRIRCRQGEARYTLVLVPK
jgi:hypothetical protein